MSALAPARSDSREVLSRVQVAPSILAADYARLGEHVQEVLDAGARVIHCDVMDGHFVPPITFGANVVAALREQIHRVGGLIDAHLMVEHPERQIEAFAAAGADIITIHSEATPNLHYLLGAIRQTGCLAGVAINPGTPAEQLAAVAEMLDLALCMTVNPGWGGQRFIASTLGKIARLRAFLPEECVIELDGGVNGQTIAACAAAGAGLLVAGSAVFGHSSPGTAFRELSASAVAG